MDGKQGGEWAEVKHKQIKGLRTSCLSDSLILYHQTLKTSQSENGVLASSSDRTSLLCTACVFAGLTQHQEVSYISRKTYLHLWDRERRTKAFYTCSCRKMCNQPIMVQFVKSQALTCSFYFFNQKKFIYSTFVFIQHKDGVKPQLKILKMRVPFLLQVNPGVVNLFFFH